MDKIDFVDEIPRDGREKYPVILDAIKEASVGGNEGRWAVVAHFDKIAVAHDAAVRLRRKYDGFDISARMDTEGGGGTVYARFIGEDYA